LTQVKIQGSKLVWNYQVEIKVIWHTLFGTTVLKHMLNIVFGTIDLKEKLNIQEKNLI
jgi:hypothetical protein